MLSNLQGIFILYSASTASVVGLSSAALVSLCNNLCGLYLITKIAKSIRCNLLLALVKWIEESATVFLQPVVIVHFSPSSLIYF